MRITSSARIHARCPWVPAENTDGMIITAMSVNGRQAWYSTPDRAHASALDHRPNRRRKSLRSTRARILLSAAIKASATATIDIEWNHKLPGGPGSGHRMTQRWADSLFQPTQWFPRVAVYDDLRGWDPESYLGPIGVLQQFWPLRCKARRARWMDREWHRHSCRIRSRCSQLSRADACRTCAREATARSRLSVRAKWDQARRLRRVNDSSGT